MTVVLTLSSRVDKTTEDARIRTMSSTKFSAWLENKYIAWLSETGERRSLRQFAEWLGISSALLSRYMGGTRKPSGDFLERIALKLGDEAYDMAGMERPDPLLRKLKGRWGRLSQAQREQIERILDE